MLALAIPAIPAVLLSQSTVRHRPPITLRYIKTGEFNNQGNISYGTTFWATTHTDKVLAIQLSTLEVKAGSNWTTRRLQGQPLLFRPPTKPCRNTCCSHMAPVTPHSSSLGQPTVGTWRVRVDVDGQLSGPAETTTRLRRYPSLMKRRFRTGDTNIPANPFSTNITSFKRVGQVVSQEISEE